MISELLPPDAVGAEAFGDLNLADACTPLLPEESQAIAHAAEPRRREFAAVRVCARQAMNELGIEPRPLIPGVRGAPTWPDAIVGSMTHCAGYRACAVAPSARYAAIGIDAEPDSPLTDGVARLVMSPAERRRASRLRHGERLVFCIKEAVYKAWSTLTAGAGRQPRFADAEVDLDEAGSFTARLLIPGPFLGGARLTTFTGRWTARHGLLLTALAVPRSPALPSS